MTVPESLLAAVPLDVRLRRLNRQIAQHIARGVLLEALAELLVDQALLQAQLENRAAAALNAHMPMGEC